MDLLIYEETYDRIRNRLQEVAPGIVPLVMDADGAIRREGEGKIENGVNPEIVFASTDLFIRGPARDFIVAAVKSDNLKWFQSGAAGFEHPIFASIREKGCIFTNSNATAKSIAEFVMASVLEAFHPFEERRRAQKNKKWQRFNFRDVAGTTWLIFGTGNIGREVAVRAKAFETTVVGVRRHPTGEEPVDEMITPDRLPQLVPRADVVVLTAASNESTRHVVDRDFLAAMKEGSVLVNIARGALVDEAALIEALDRGIPEIAILDVTEEEPLPEESPLWAHPRVRLTAHCSAFSPATEPRGDDVFLGNLERFLAGEPLSLVVSG